MEKVYDQSQIEYLLRDENIFNQPELAFLTADPADSEFWMAHFHQLGRYVAKHQVEGSIGTELSAMQEELIDDSDQCEEWLRLVVGQMAYDHGYQIRIRKGGVRSRRLELPAAILYGYIRDPLLIFYSAEEHRSFSQSGKVVDRFGVPKYSFWKSQHLQKIKESKLIGATSLAGGLSFGRTIPIRRRRS